LLILLLEALWTFPIALLQLHGRLMSQAIEDHGKEKRTLCPELQEVDNAPMSDATIKITITVDPGEMMIEGKAMTSEVQLVAVKLRSSHTPNVISDLILLTAHIRTIHDAVRMSSRRTRAWETELSSASNKTNQGCHAARMIATAASILARRARLICLLRTIFR